MISHSSLSRLAFALWLILPIGVRPVILPSWNPPLVSCSHCGATFSGECGAPCEAGLSAVDSLSWPRAAVATIPLAVRCPICGTCGGRIAASADPGRERGEIGRRSSPLIDDGATAPIAH